LGTRITEAVCGTRYFDGGGTEAPGELRGEDGGLFYGAGNAIMAHPPYRAGGGGEAYAVLSLALPADTDRFAADVYLDSAAVGEDRSDGVTFAVQARAGDATARAERHTATAEHVELALDLRPFAGKEVTIELSVHPGPALNPSYDWARWESPRVERATRTVAPLAIAGLSGWSVALAGQSQCEIPPGRNRIELSTPFPGGVYLLKNLPGGAAQTAPAALPVDLATQTWSTAFVSDAGVALQAPAHACVKLEEGAVGGVTRRGLFIHPPNYGRTIADFPMRFPGQVSAFHAYIGLRDGGESSGVVFSVEVNGVELARERTTGGAWTELRADLAPWAGKPAILSLITDSARDYICDLALWGEPRVN
jgi:hypothetical protein